MKFDLVASLKEFFFDIVGFFIPGFLVLVICKLILEVELDLEKNVYVTIIASYLIGYIIFSITLLKDKLINYFIKKTESSRTWFCIAFNYITISSRKIMSDLNDDETYKIASNIIKEESKEGQLVLKKFNSFRSYAMSVAPESDKKVYTFMFRAELFNQLHTITVLAFIAVLIVSLSSTWNSETLKNAFEQWWLVGFLLMTFTLRQGWKRFFSISMRIPFSIYLAKIKRVINEP